MTTLAVNKLETGEPIHCCGIHGRKQGDREQDWVPTEEPAITDSFILQRIGVFPILIGVIAALAVVGFYLGLLTLNSDWFYARMQFAEFRWWIIALSVGLGIQATLFTYMRKRLRGNKLTAATSGLAASGGMSTASMAACCAHYLVTVLPVLGVPFVTTAVSALERYQTVFFFITGISFGIPHRVI